MRSLGLSRPSRKWSRIVVAAYSIYFAGIVRTEIVRHRATRATMASKHAAERTV